MAQILCSNERIIERDETLLLHICCAPCSISVIASLLEQGESVTGFWYNFNIHPTTEYLARRDCLRTYLDQIDIPLLERDEYGLEDFLQKTHGQSNRCAICYETRLRATAQMAQASGFSEFTTTLLISPYQNHELLVETGNRVAAESGVRFREYDFRPLFSIGQTAARELGLYRQKYCGCIFSEAERYKSKTGARK
jgi:predicted adenine nucleotide alpha hydrolase (AANH) superfamily ATPase